MHRPIETIKRSIPVSDEEIETLGKQGWWIAGGANGYIYFQRDIATGLVAWGELSQEAIGRMKEGLDSIPEEST